MADRPIPAIRRLRLTDYKSIPSCDVDLGRLAVVVGPNASGKSNFISSLSFLSQAVSANVYSALDNFGGIDSILRRGPEQTQSFSINVEGRLRWGPNSDQWPIVKYGFEIGRPPGYRVRTFEVLHETCDISDGDRHWGYSANRGRLSTASEERPDIDIDPDRLYLPIAARSTTYTSLFNTLVGVRLYEDFSAGLSQQPSFRVGGQTLEPDGSNVADVLTDIMVARPEIAARINTYLRAISPNIIGVTTMTIGENLALVVQQRVGDVNSEVEFPARSVSSGIWHAICVLVALYQIPAIDGRLSLVAIEEPGISLHPAAAGVLFDALEEATEHVQVVVTNHSPELLDRDELDLKTVIPVRLISGMTRVGQVDRSSREIVREQLYTAGDLMRNDQLIPESGHGDGEPDTAE
jgi:predicted ATPase